MVQGQGFILREMGGGRVAPRLGGETGLHVLEKALWLLCGEAVRCSLKGERLVALASLGRRRVSLDHTWSGLW